MYRGRILAGGVVVLAWAVSFGVSDPNTVSDLSKSDPCIPEPTIQRWMVWPFWQALRPGMSKEEVLALLGEPLETESTETACVWYYQQTPQRLASGVVQRPRFALLNFKKTVLGGEEVMVLKNWRVPDWNQARTYSVAEFEAEQETIRRLREEALQKQKRAEEQRRREEERIRRQEAIRQQQLEQQQQLRAQQAAGRREGFSLADIPRPYWYAAGGVIAGLVIAVIFIKKPFVD